MWFNSPTLESVLERLESCSLRSGRSCSWPLGGVLLTERYFQCVAAVLLVAREEKQVLFLVRDPNGVTKRLAAAVSSPDAAMTTELAAECLHRVRFRQCRDIYELLCALDHVQQCWEVLIETLRGGAGEEGCSMAPAGGARTALRLVFWLSGRVGDHDHRCGAQAHGGTRDQAAAGDDNSTSHRLPLTQPDSPRSAQVAVDFMALETLSARPRTQSGGAGLIQSSKAGHVSVDVRPEADDETPDGNDAAAEQSQADADGLGDGRRPGAQEKGEGGDCHGQDVVCGAVRCVCGSRRTSRDLLEQEGVGCSAPARDAHVRTHDGIERKQLEPGQKQLMVYFSLIFVSNIITGNWSLGLVSISFNQVMRALVPAVVVVLSMLILGKSYSLKRKLSLVPVAFGVYLACTGDNSCTVLGFIITVVAIIFAGLKAVLSNKFLSGDLKLHPVDLILHQAPLSAFWCLITMFLTGEVDTIINNWEVVPSASFWFILTGVISFMLNVTSFMANKVTSPVTLCVCGNMKQVVVIVMSILINHDVITVQKAIGIVVVSIGGATYAYISTKETMGQSTLPAPAKTTKVQTQKA
ncbi:Sugar phosphate transporter domain [Phytophthora cactorum]|nr:Sugar phosphate transporter domain [Phytophthora cactorum]